MKIKKYIELFESAKTQEKFFKDVEKLVKKYGGLVNMNNDFGIELEIMSEYGKYIIVSTS